MSTRTLPSLLFCILLLSTPPGAFAQLRFFFGNLHAHSGYSDGCKDGLCSTPKSCFTLAKQSEQLHFLGISEHNHDQQNTGMELENYAKGLQQADEANEDGEFVCLYGLEFGTNRYGHVLIYGLTELPGWEEDNHDVECQPDDFSKLWRLVNDAGAFATLAHPEREHYENLSTSNKRPSADKAICGTAIANGPHSSSALDYSEEPGLDYYKYYRTLLARGYRVGPTIDHDNHNATFGRTAASRTVVLAEALEREQIIEAYKKMRFYASEDWNIEVTFTIQGKPMGSEINSRYQPTIRVEVSDADEEEIKYIKVMYGRAGSNEEAKALASVLEKDYIVAPDTHIKKGQTFYYFIEIQQKDGDKIVTAPIWFKRIY